MTSTDPLPLWSDLSPCIRPVQSHWLSQCSTNTKAPIAFALIGCSLCLSSYMGTLLFPSPPNLYKLTSSLRPTRDPTQFWMCLLPCPTALLIILIYFFLYHTVWFAYLWCLQFVSLHSFQNINSTRPEIILFTELSQVSRTQVANTRPIAPSLALHLVLSGPAPCFYQAAVPSSLLTVK